MRKHAATTGVDMLSFKQLSEKKTKVKINPKLDELKEKKGTCPKTGDAECKCDEKTPAQKSICPTCRGTGMVDGKTCPTCGGKKTKPMEEQAYVSQEEVSEESTEEVAETETLLTFGQFNEDRAADAKASLEKVKARQKVLDAHEKKTGKKLDINKSVEARDHKKNFPGAKRTGKKVKGAKETPAQTQDRRIRQASTRIATRGYTSKEKKNVQSMAKHASRFD
jgi:DnaJ-class molecular chaperone